MSTQMQSFKYTQNAHINRQTHGPKYHTHPPTNSHTHTYTDTHTHADINTNIRTLNTNVCTQQTVQSRPALMAMTTNTHTQNHTRTHTHKISLSLSLSLSLPHTHTHTQMGLVTVQFRLVSMTRLMTVKYLAPLPLPARKHSRMHPRQQARRRSRRRRNGEIS
jgi:hypothetical protein